MGGILPAGPARGAGSVTGVVVARNEEANIEGCLRSLSWADRILVIDNGSTDRTAAICARSTAWVVPREVAPGIDPVHDNVNFALGLIPEGWVLQIDADERATAALAREVRAAAAAAAAASDASASDAPHAGYWVPFRIAVLGRWVRHGYWGSGSRQVRLVRAGKARYPMRSLHENFAVDGPLGALRSPIYHLPFPTVSEFVRKADLYTSREVDLILHGDSPGVTGLGMRAAHPSGARILWAGTRLFLWSYVKRGGWREGRVGVATSVLLGLYGTLETLKVWERAEALSGPIPLPEDEPAPAP